MDIIRLIIVMLILLILSAVIAIYVVFFLNKNTVSDDLSTLKTNIQNNTELITKNSSNINSLNSEIVRDIEYIYDSNARVIITTTDKDGNVILGERTITNEDKTESTSYNTSICSVYGYIDKTTGHSILSTNYFTTTDLTNKANTTRISYITGVKTSKYQFSLVSIDNKYPGTYTTICNTSRTEYFAENVELKDAKFTDVNVKQGYKISGVCINDILVKISDMEFICDSYKSSELSA